MRHVLIATVLTVLTAFPVHADDRAECIAGIDRLRAGVSARPAPANLTDLRLTLSRAEREFASREFDDCVNVLKRASVGKDDKDDKNGKDGDDDGPDTDHMFGFTQGSDIIEKGKVEISGEAVGAFSKRVGRYRAGRLIGSFDFAPADRLSIEFGARGNAFRSATCPILTTDTAGASAAFPTEIKWQAVKRGPSFPFGLTFVIEPDVTIRDDEAGARGRGVGLETRLALDTEIVPKTVFGAVNLLYEIEKFRPRVLRRFNSEGELLEGPPSGACPVNADDAPETCLAFARRREAERSSLIGVSAGTATVLLLAVFCAGAL